MKYEWRRALKHFLHAALLILLTVTAAFAQASPVAKEPATASAGSRVKSTLLFFTGAGTGLVVHEFGHVAFGAAFGANPRVRPLEGSAIPFFKIEHDLVSRRQEFVISSAGFWMQYADAEWILTKHPDLRHRSAPFEKGILAFDLGASTVYSIAAFSQRGAIERDTHGMAVSLGTDGWPEPVVGAFVLAPAAFDGIRYLKPEAKWAVWASRVSKIASVALVAAAGR
jgi:hypothetical protein